MSKEDSWEEVDRSETPDDTTYTYRLKVPGGWLYKVEHYSEGELYMNVVFASGK